MGDSTDQQKCLQFSENAKMKTQSEVYENGDRIETQKFVSFCHPFYHDQETVWVLGEKSMSCLNTCNPLGMAVTETAVPRRRSEFQKIKISYEYSYEEDEMQELTVPKSVADLCSGGIVFTKTWSAPAINSNNVCFWNSRYLGRNADPDMLAKHTPEEDTARLCPCLKSTPTDGDEELGEKYDVKDRRNMKEVEMSDEDFQKIVRRSKKRARVLYRKNNRSFGILAMVLGFAVSAVVVMSLMRKKEVLPAERNVERQC